MSGPEPSARGNFTPPPRTAASPAEEPGSDAADAASSGSSSRFSPRNWRVPVRLNAILLIPVIIAVVMGGFQVKGSVDTWQEARDAEKTALVVRAAEDYGQALLNERDLSAPDLLTKSETTEKVKKLRAETDAAKAAFDEVVKDMPDIKGLNRRVDAFRTSEAKLPKLREQAYVAAMDPTSTELGYRDIQHTLMELGNELSLDSGNSTSYGRTVYAVSLTKASVSLQRAIGTHLLVRPSSDSTKYKEQLTSFASFAYLEQIAIDEFISAGTDENVATLKAALKKHEAESAKKVAAAAEQAKEPGQPAVTPPSMTEMISLIGSGEMTPEQLAKAGVTPETWAAASTGKFEGYREVETGLVDQAVTDAGEIADDAQRDAYITGAAVVAAVLIAFLIAAVMARQMSTSMRRLRTAAFGIAEQRLPMLVDQLSRTEPGKVDTRVEPIPITTQDEIGEVARAFDQVHREAVRLAAEQALLRGNINAIFTNLSRRNQSLIEGQLTLITDLENNEADPDQLENLFRLDHLATRMRRNGENLLVLAGEDVGRSWDQPVPLVDVLRAASSEVEQYERIELSGVPEAEIHGRSVTDLVHLLAELLENATTFSSPQTKVKVTATRLPDGRVMIEIHDKGIGLTAEDFADINHRLANPPTVDAAISQHMGLFVVGRLADRHDIRVQLRPSGEQAGTTSLIMLPDVITHGGGGSDLPENEFTVSQMIPQQDQAQQAFAAPPVRTAAELGFDDSRYDDTPSVPDDARALDPLGRSLMREERRAALEAQSPDRSPFQDEREPQPEHGGFDAQQQAFDAQQQAYEGSQQPYEAQRAGYDDQRAGYDAQQQTGYDDGQQQSGYDGQQQAYRDQGGQQDGFGNRQQSGYDGHQSGGYQQSDGYPEPAYAEPGYDGHAPRQSSGQQPQYDGYDDRSHQGTWQQEPGYQDAYQPAYNQEAQSGPGAPAGGDDRVGFGQQAPSAPASNASHDLTDAGLPRRGSTAARGQADPAGQQWQPGPAAQGTPPRQRPADHEPPAGAAGNDGDGAADEGWQSANDDRWQRAEQLRKPKAGGVTPSGLPRRVPKANLVEGTAEQTPQGGPQVSRDPEDVRGRLSNLRRGVQRGRGAGSDTNGQGFGLGGNYNQER
ncbi:sensor histidine kinase [Streptomyces sp. O3]